LFPSTRRRSSGASAGGSNHVQAGWRKKPAAPNATSQGITEIVCGVPTHHQTRDGITYPAVLPRRLTTHSRARLAIRGMFYDRHPSMENGGRHFEVIGVGPVLRRVSHRIEFDLHQTGIGLQPTGRKIRGNGKRPAAEAPHAG